jgi:putative transposase
MTFCKNCPKLSFMVVEGINVKGLLQSNLAKSISDSSWSKFLTYLRYKAGWYGRTFIQAAKFFPSSKLCHCCRYKKEDLTLYERTWTCPVCGRAHDRDVNASINLYFVGLEQSEVKPVERRGESLCEAGSSIFYKVEWFTEFSSYLQGRNYIESATLDKRTNNMI